MEEVEGIYGGIKFRETIYVSPKIKELLENPDALSMSVTIFKHGGIVDGEEAVPYVRIHKLENVSDDHHHCSN